MYHTIAEVKKANKAIGHKWFSPANMRFFKTHIVKGHYGGRLIQSRFFITSDDVWGLGRRYIIRAALDNGAVETASETKFMSWQVAEEIAKKLKTESSPCANCRKSNYNPNFTCDDCAGDARLAYSNW
jgi:1,4-dihydroxy-2-naphthoyl-CoA synthase